MTDAEATALLIEIQRLEDERAAYLRDHYGPLWGETDEAVMARLDSRLRRLYDRANVHEYDRVAGI